MHVVCQDMFAAVTAKRYIEKHYKVNAGNYSRDNDYVGGVYGGS